MPRTDYQPSLGQVGLTLPTRTRDAGGNVLNTFSPSTNPTDVEAAQAVADALDDVALRIGDDIPTQAWEAARRIVALRAAMLIELRFFSEQIRDNRSPYPQLREMYEGINGNSGELQALIDRIDMINANEPGPVVSKGGMPAYSFPTTRYGWDTRRM